MPYLVHQIVAEQAKKFANTIAVEVKNSQLSYQSLDELIDIVHLNFRSLGLNKFTRVGIYLGKTLENVVSLFAISKSGGVFVPINPVLKAEQVKHIANDCDIEILITNFARFKSLLPILNELPNLKTVILIDKPSVVPEVGAINLVFWQNICTRSSENKVAINITATANDMAAIFYTSGSTGKPKGVVLSHANIILGAMSVAQYLENDSNDVILAVLPFSFDYGFSQLTTALLVGAKVVLLDYLLPNDVLNAISKHKVTGLAGVPPLWSQLSKLDWQDRAHSIRYFTNSGGALNPNLLMTLRGNMPNAIPYLMYGLTEAFRSTYLNPDLIDIKPTSMGQAIPNVEVMVVRDNGSECDIGEEGELVHIGPLVSLGYWNAIDKTNEKFRYVQGKPEGITVKQKAVFSGDRVVRDIDGDLFFIGRNDEMIKSSGYRISPMEIEECFYQHENILDVVALGVPHEELGQAILIVCSLNDQSDSQIELTVKLKKHCQKYMANYMQPTNIILLPDLPKNGNGKLDRANLSKNYNNYYKG